LKSFIGPLAAALALLLTAPAPAQNLLEASPAPALTPLPIATPQPAPDNARVHKVAVQQFLAWQEGSVDPQLYGDQVAAQLTPAFLDQASKTLAQLGGLQQAKFLGISRVKAGALYVYDMVCEHGAVNMAFDFDPDGRIAVIFFQ
jgi:hypothetical protein